MTNQVNTSLVCYKNLRKTKKRFIFEWLYRVY